MSTTSNFSSGIVLSSSRRFVEIIDSSQNTYLGSLASRKLEAAPGDRVNFTLNKRTSEETFADIHSIDKRKNLLKRSYERKTKLLAANLDILFIVTAPPPIFNTTSIDRMLCAAASENIKTVLIANKTDISEFKKVTSSLEYYEGLGVQVVRTNALDGHGIPDIIKLISREGNSIYAFSGVSGVGKSTILSKIFPGHIIRTGDVSEKTGQGKQTTSSAQGYILPFSDNLPSEFPSILVDLPGIQQFGLSHLDIEDIQNFMPDMNRLRTNCKFNDCQHLQEPACAIKSALETGEILESRFISYKEVIKEIKSSTSY